MTEAESPKSVPRSPKQDTKEIKEQNTEISEEISDLNSLGFFNESRISSVYMRYIYRRIGELKCKSGSSDPPLGI